MPEIKIYDPDSIAGEFLTECEIESLFFFPTNIEERNQFKATRHAMAMGGMGFQLPPESKHNLLKKEILTSWRSEEEFYLYIATAKGFDFYEKKIKKKNSEILTVGRMFTFMISVDTHHKSMKKGGASINKAADFAVMASRENHAINRVFDAKPYLDELSAIKKAWRKYLPIAHLCASVSNQFELFKQSIDGFKKKDIPLTPQWNDDIKEFLNVSVFFQDYLIKRYGDEHDIYMINDIEKANLSIPPLTENALEIFNNYKAPQNI